MNAPRKVPYASRAGFRWTRLDIALAAAAAAGLTAIVLIYVLTWGAPPSSFDGYVYVESNRTTRNTILAYRFTDSRFRLVDEYPTGGRGSVDFGETGALDADGQIAVDLTRRLLFAVNQGSDTIAVFHLAEGGRLDPVPGSPFPARGKAPASVGVAGAFLVVANKAHDAGRELGPEPPRYVVFRIGPTGALTPAGKPFEALVGASPTQVLPVTPHLIVSTEEVGPFRVLRLGEDGSLKDAPNSPLPPEESIFKPGYEGVRWSLGLSKHPTRPIVYANQAATEQLLVYRVAPDGRLTFVYAAQNPHSDLPCWSVVTPDGKRLYTANAGNGTVTAFDLSRDPLRPRRIQTIRVKSGANPWGLALDPAGRTLFVVDPFAVDRVPSKRLGNRLHALYIDDGGRLTEVAASPVLLPVGHDATPYGIAVVPR
jgi:hypothetical protein